MTAKPLYRAVEMETHLLLIQLLIRVELKPELLLHTNPMEDAPLTALAKYQLKQEEQTEPVHDEYLIGLHERLAFLSQRVEHTTNQTEELEHLQTIVLGEQMDHKIAM